MSEKVKEALDRVKGYGAESRGNLYAAAYGTVNAFLICEEYESAREFTFEFDRWLKEKEKENGE